MPGVLHLTDRRAQPGVLYRAFRKAGHRLNAEAYARRPGTRAPPGIVRPINLTPQKKA